MASLIDLPKHQEDFDQTLGVWGVPTGPYLVLPLLGPSSPRGVTGLIGDAATNPATYVGFGAFPGMSNGIETAISSGMYVLNAIDKRADNIATEKSLVGGRIWRPLRIHQERLSATQRLSGE